MNARATEPGFINYIQPQSFSLKEMSIVSVLTRLLHNPVVKKMLMELRSTIDRQEKDNMFTFTRVNSSGYYDFSSVERRIERNLQMLHVPKPLRKQILHFVKPMSAQLLKCFTKGEEEFELYNHLEYDGSIFWTAEGTIDKKKTLEHWILDTNRQKDVCWLFRIASKNCYESYIFQLWELLPSNVKTTWLSQGHLTDFTRHFEYYWVCVINNCLQNLPVAFQLNSSTMYQQIHYSIHENMFKLSVSLSNFRGVQYFWSRLTEQEKSNNISFWLEEALNAAKTKTTYDHEPGPNECADIIFFLLSHLNDKEQQADFFSRFSEEILCSLYYHYPWQKYFLPTLNMTWNYLDQNCYLKIMSKIASEAREGSSEEEILGKAWRASPREFQLRFLPVHQRNVSILLRIEEVGVIARLYKEVLDQQEVNLADMIINLAKYGNYKLIDEYIHLHFNSQKKINEFKNHFLTTHFCDLMYTIVFSKEINEKINSSPIIRFYDLMQKFIFGNSKKDFYIENGWNLLEKLVNYFLCTDEEVKHVEHRCRMSVWPTPNNTDAICKFKEQMISSNHSAELPIQLIFFNSRDSSNSSWENTARALKFFLPLSRRTVAELKSKVDQRFNQATWQNQNMASNCKKAIFSTLDIVSDNRRGPFDENKILLLLKMHLEEETGSSRKRRKRSMST